MCLEIDDSYYMHIIIIIYHPFRFLVLYWSDGIFISRNILNLSTSLFQAKSWEEKVNIYIDRFQLTLISKPCQVKEPNDEERPEHLLVHCNISHEQRFI